MPKNHFNNKYFLNRNLNDVKRLKIFDFENKIIEKYVKKNSKILDVGCGTGEFLKFIEWKGKKFGMEINSLAKKIAKKNGINFNCNLLNKTNFFDVIIFRGTIQHLPYPFYYLEKSFKSLKKNGIIIFFSTPNINSISYKFFNNLHLLKPIYYYAPSNLSLENALKNFDFKICENNFYPYTSSPYSNFFLDHLKFILTLLKIKKENDFPFYKNMFYIVAKK